MLYSNDRSFFFNDHFLLNFSVEGQGFLHRHQANLDALAGLSLTPSVLLFRATSWLAQTARVGLTFSKSIAEKADDFRAQCRIWMGRLARQHIFLGRGLGCCVLLFSLSLSDRYQEEKFQHQINKNPGINQRNCFYHHILAPSIPIFFWGVLRPRRSGCPSWCIAISLLPFHDFWMIFMRVLAYKATNPKHRKGYVCPGLVAKVVSAQLQYLRKGVPHSRKLGWAFCSWEPAILNHINQLCSQEFPGTPPLCSLEPRQSVFVPGNFLAIYLGTFPKVLRNNSQELFLMICGGDIGAGVARKGLLIFLRCQA